MEERAFGEAHALNDLIHRDSRKAPVQDHRLGSVEDALARVIALSSHVARITYLTECVYMPACPIELNSQRDAYGNDTDSFIEKHTKWY